MSQKSRTTLSPLKVVSAAVVLVVWAWASGASPSEAVGETASIEPASQEAGLGESITVSVVASGVTDMVGFQCDLSFNNTVFEVTDIDLGDGLGSWPSEVDSLAATRETPGGTAEYLNGLTDPSATLLTEINSDGGLRIGTSNTVPFTDEKALDGTGTLAIISFDIIGDPGPSSTLDLNDCSFSVGLSSPSTIAPTEQDGEVCALAPCGDVDCDDDVDAVDALFILQYVVGMRLGSDQCPPPEGHLYLPAGDVDCDGDVDAVDALFVLQHVVGLRPELCVCPVP